jgi:hypothetical protein
MGQSSREFPLQEEGLAYPTITGAGEKECTAPTAGRSQQHFAAYSSFQTGLMKNLVKVMNQRGPAFRYLAEGT